MEKSPKMCKNCQKHDVRRGNKFCSMSCAASFNNRGVRRHGTSRVLKPCKNCGNKTYNAVFCSRKCSLERFNSGREKQGSIQCVWCGVRMAGGSFCSLTCKQSFAWEERKKKFLASGDTGCVSDGGRRKFLKKYLVEVRGKRCEICGIVSWMGKCVPLVLDHISGNSGDDSLENLRLVCGNCDMQLPTYKGKNKGSGRAWRKRLSIV